MKKTLIAMAAVAVAGTASAQVTISGRVDAGHINDHGTDTRTVWRERALHRNWFQGLKTRRRFVVAFTVRNWYVSNCP